MTRQCPQCGAPLSPGALEGLCPACLLQQGASPETATQGDPTPFQPPELAEVVRLFPQLEIIAFIGKGGMGAVYKARQPALDRLVALKILPPQVAGGLGFTERFSREARALAKLNHPNIVAVYEFGQVEALPFFLMEFVDGLNLRELERAGKLSPREALKIVPQICEALQFAHDEGVVHRDIKPENILLDKKGRVKIADFGIAKIMGRSAPDSGAEAGAVGEHGTVVLDAKPSRLTEEGKIVGTPNYMAPEQVDTPQSVDHRADIFSLGVVFYEMLTGELPLGKFAPPSSRTRGVTVDVRLDEVVLRALEREPERRYQQASQVKSAVETIAGQAAPAQNAPWGQGFEFRSRATWYGLPLVHVATGCDPVTGRARVARGIIAIGGIAQGVVAFGGVAMGGLTFGGLSLGVLAFGGCAFGLATFGGLAVALLMAFGGGAVAPIAVGGGAIGYFAYGGGVLAVHPLGANASDEMARHFFMPWAPQAMALAPAIFPLLLIFMLFATVLVPLWLQRASVSGGTIAPMPAPPAGLGAANQGKPGSTALGAVALILAGLAGLLGVITFCLHPHAPDVLVWSILVYALLGVALGIASRKSRLGKQAIFDGSVITAIWLVVAATHLFRGAASPLIKSDYIGHAWFPRGDSIKITLVDRTQDRMTVKGHYNLASTGNALLAFNITSTNEAGTPQDPRQQMNISKGSGDFELTHADLVPGFLHVSMYGSDGQSFGDLYFGTLDKALRLVEVDVPTPTSPDQTISNAAGFGPVMENSVSFDTNGVTDFLNLESNQAVQFRNMRGSKLPDGVVFLEDTDTNMIYVQSMYQTFFTRAGGEAWETISAEKSMELMSTNTSLKTIDALNVNDLPWTILFTTAPGMVGLMRVSKSEAGNDGLDIRYKFVNQGLTNGVFVIEQFARPNLADGSKPIVSKPIPSEAVRLFNQGQEVTVRLAALQDRWPARIRSHMVQAARIELDLQELGRQEKLLTKGTSFERARWKVRQIWNELRQTSPSKQGEKRARLEVERQVAQFDCERLMVDAGAAAFIQPDAKDLKFGPWIDATVLHPSAGTNCCINFESGHLLTPPPDILRAMPAQATPGSDIFKAMPEEVGWFELWSVGSPPSPVTRWLRGAQVDAVEIAPSRLLIFCPVGTATSLADPVANPDWERNLTPAWLLWKCHFTEKMRNAQPKQSNTVEALSFPSDPGRFSDNLCLFRTAAGTLGILQITGTNDNPPGVKIRYKLVQGAANPTTSTTSGFGPVIERVVADSKDPNITAGSNGSLLTNAPIMIDFDSGRLYAGSKEIWNSGDYAQKLWMQDNGVDALGVVPEVNGLVGLDMAAISVGNELWDTCNAKDVLGQMSRAKTQETFLFDARVLLPSTWLFRTREGGAGILQITGFTENPRGVKLRYKLVQSGGTNSPIK